MNVTEKRRTVISPSFLAADFARLDRELDDVARAGAEYIHLDVMDGVFVPNISFGLPVISSLRAVSKLVFDTHLMIVEPEKYVARFARAGADIITFHLEATNDPAGTLRLIRENGARAAISIKPGTPAEAVFPYIPLCDMILVMTVEPGFGGQKFMSDMLPKIAAIRAEADRIGADIDIQVDGGIDAVTAAECARAGANVFVAGSSVFGAADRADAVSAIRIAADNI